MNAEQKREKQQRQLIERVTSRLCSDDEGKELLEPEILDRASDLISAVIGEMVGTEIAQMEPLDPKVVAALSEINGFSRAIEEERILRKRLLEKMIASGLRQAEYDYLGLAVHDPKKLYDGHGAMDEVEF